MRIILFFSLSFILIKTYSQEEKFKALFVLNFIKYIEWPDAAKNDGFNIFVVGETEIFNEIKLIIPKLEAVISKVSLNKANTINDLKNPDILYISKNCPIPLAELLKNIASSNTLIITEKTGLCDKGSAINFIIKNGNINFEINKSNIDNKGLKVSTKLLSLAANAQ